MAIIMHSSRQATIEHCNSSLGMLCIPQPTIPLPHRGRFMIHDVRGNSQSTRALTLKRLQVSVLGFLPHSALYLEALITRLQGGAASSRAGQRTRCGS